jgi:hypothetical protein
MHSREGTRRPAPYLTGMAIEHGHATCDGCPRSGPAVARLDSDTFDTWQRIEMDGAEGTWEAHLCPVCRQKAARGWWPLDAVWECARCGQDTVDHRGKVRAWIHREETILCAECWQHETGYMVAGARGST